MNRACCKYLHTENAATKSADCKLKSERGLFTTILEGFEMKYENRIFDEERALYALKDSTVENCKFDGPADGESALKEASCIKVKNCFINLRYPLWHVTDVQIAGCELT